jgi:hypothetical protein
MKRIVAVCVLAALLAAAFAAVAQACPPLPPSDPYPLVIRQLTSWPNTSRVSYADAINYDGTRVGLWSTANLTGENPSGQQEVFAQFADGTGLRQLTHGANTASTLYMSGNGEMIAFGASGNLTGQNPDGSREIFVVSFDGTITRQLTFTTNPAYSLSGTRMSHDGQWVACNGNADPTGENADHSGEVFVVRSDGTGLTQLSHESNPAYRVNGDCFSADGQKVAWASTSDYLGTNPDHSWEIFIINRDGTGLAQVTNNANPALRFDVGYGITSDGATLLIYGTANPTGQNPDGHNEMFMVNSDGTNLRQLTCDPNFDSTMGMMSYDGTLVTFRSRADFTGENPDHSNEVFAMMSDGTHLTQVSRYDGPGVGSVLDRPSGDGRHIAFTSNGNQTGQNPDLSTEGFIADIASLPTTLVLNSVSPASVTVGSTDPVVFTATLTRNDTAASVVGATVAFSVDGNPVGTAVTGGGGIVTLNYDPSALAPGSHTVQASFGEQTIGGITFLASTSDTVSIAVNDTTPPTLTVPPDVSATTTDPNGTAVDVGTATATDNADPNPTVTSDAPAIFPVGVTTVTWTATDASGNSAQGTQRVTVTLLRYANFTWQQPMANAGNRLFKRGSTIPVKFTITDLQGNPATGAVATLAVYYFHSGAPEGDPLVVSTANGDVGNQFRDAGGGQYIFNMSTKPHEWYPYWTFLAEVTLDDGQKFTQGFSLK